MVASPLAALTFMLLFISELFVSFNVVLPAMVGDTLSWVMPPPTDAAVAPGAFMIMPYHLPSTFTNTSRSFLPTISCPVRFSRVTLLKALPVVALPAVELLAIVALPVAAFESILFLIAELLVIVAAAWFGRPLPQLAVQVVGDATVGVVPGALLATSLSKKPVGRRISPLRLP